MKYLNSKIKGVVISTIFTFLSIASFAQCYLEISSKYDQVVAIGYDSTLWTWGGEMNWQREYTKPHILDSSKNWKQVATGEGFMMAVKSDGTLWGVGLNFAGQLGDGTTLGKTTLTRLTQDSNWVAVSCGKEFTIALKSDSTVWAWGKNNYGQLGQGTNRTNSTTPIQIGTQSNFTSVSAGLYHSLLKDSNNKLWQVGACYTSSIASQLTQVGSSSDWEDFSTLNQYSYAIKQNGTLWEFTISNGRPNGPTQIGNSTNWQELDQSSSHTSFVKTNGTLWALGDNSYGQFGNGNLSSSSTPVRIGNDNDWSNVTAGANTSFAFKNDGSFWAWGRNNHAQFGNGENKSTILPINSNTNWQDVSIPLSTFNDHVSAIKNDGTLWSWGRNTNGQLGIGVQNITHYRPIQVGNDTNWKSITAGHQFTLAIRNDGTLWGWGRNIRGQLGLGYNSFNVLSPIQIGVDTNWLKVVSGFDFSIGLKKDSTLWAWGHNSVGQLGNGLGGNNLVQNTPTKIGVDSNWMFIAAGSDYAVALKADSTLWTWGSNRSGELGRTGNNRVPQLVDSTLKFIDVQCGSNHTLAIAKDSTLWGCGTNSNWELGLNSTSNQLAFIKIDSTKKWLSVSSGNIHSLGILKDSTLWAWGGNSTGQLGDSATYVSSPHELQVPTRVSNDKWQELEAGSYTSFVINANGKMFSMGDILNSSNYSLFARTQTTPLLIDSCVICFPTDSQLSRTICKGSSYLFNNLSLTSSGIYTDTLMNSKGCDSVISLHLTVLDIDTSVVISGQTLTSIENSASYQWLDCNNAYSIIAGETSQSFTPSFNGSYAVEVTKNTCSDTSACQLISTVGILENSLLNSVKLFPNPTSNEFQIIFPSILNAQVTIFNNQGKEVESRLIFGNKIEDFSLASVKPGIYLVRIISRGELAVFKVVKK
jgi:alpha-tubulin suppressor-like RCC1 family protein